MKWLIYNELAEANNRTCDVINYFRCPYGDAWCQLLQDGHTAHCLWEHIEWYDHHWNRDHITTPAADERKWYHYDEPPIIDATSYTDIIRTVDDGRLMKIMEEHARYMTETDSESWNI